MDKLQQLFGSKTELNFPLAKITTLGMGGPAKALLTVVTSEELIQAVNTAIDHRIPYLIIGGGSNLLVADEGVSCLIIKNEMTGLSLQGESLQIQSGTILQELVDKTIKQGLSGLHKLTGIPGTVGGAIYGNAGAYGQTISDCLTECTVYDPEQNQVLTLSKNECKFTYRSSLFKSTKLIILRAKFKTVHTDKAILVQESTEILTQRQKKYPLTIKCPGSFFKNIIFAQLPTQTQTLIPPDKVIHGKVTAGYLLEEVGAKGQKLGSIEVADYHGNLILNKGEGKAADFYNLAKLLGQKVKDKFGIELEPEVQFINLPPLKYV